MSKNYDNLSWEEKELLETERLQPMVDRLAELALRQKEGKGSFDEGREIDEILQKGGRGLVDKYGDGLESAEHTSENIAFIKLPNNLFLEVSISGSFNVSSTRVCDQVQKDARLKALDDFQEQWRKDHPEEK